MYNDRLLPLRTGRRIHCHPVPDPATGDDRCPAGWTRSTSAPVPTASGMENELAVIETSPQRLREVVRAAALDSEGNDPYEEMFVEVDDDALETPGGAEDATQASYCTFRAERFERLAASEPVTALFPVPDLLAWLDWLAAESTLRVSFVGERGLQVASRLVLASHDRTVSLSCLDDPAVLESIDTWLPDRFEDGRFLDTAGRPMPTRIQTTAGALRPIVEAVDRCAGVDSYPLTTTADGLSFEASGDMASVTGELDAVVSGPDVDNLYGPGFARVVRGLEGQVELHTAPQGDLAVLSDHPSTRLRFYVAARSSPP